MANNKTVDNGTLPDIDVATDEIGGVDYQLVKLVSGTEDATDRIPGDANYGLRTMAYPPLLTAWSYHEASSSALTDTSVQAAPGAGLSIYVTDIVVSLGAASDLNVFLEEGASTVLGPYYLEAVVGRGIALSFKTPKKITVNTALTITTSAAVAHAIDITGFVAAG